MTGHRVALGRPRELDVYSELAGARFGVAGPCSTKWMRRAACAGLDPALFFAERGGSTDQARQTCVRCPVRVQCLVYGAGERHGTWGGTDTRERRALRVDLKRSARRAA